MTYEQKYYIAESGKILEQAEQFRKDYIKWGDDIRAFIVECGAETGQVGYGGRLFSLRFSEDAPKGFKKPNENGCQSPYAKNKLWLDKLKNSPQEPFPSDYIKKAMDVVTGMKYEKGTARGACSIGHPFTPVSVYYYSESSPLLVMLPDIEAAVARKEADGYTVTTDKTHSSTDGLREILKEEWDFMAAKYKHNEATQ